MSKSWTGPAVVGLIVIGIASFLLLNIQPSGTRTSSPGADGSATTTQGNSGAAGKAPESSQTAPGSTPETGGLAVREFPIGDEVEKNHIRVAAVWLPAVMMDGMTAGGSDHPIHIEADVKATEGNPNGFAKDEKVSYLKIAYKVVPASGGAPLAEGELSPMMARDGFHYGATIAMPKPGSYRLIYELQPPSAGGLGRHSDPATGVAPWWGPFSAEFDWTVAAPAAEVSLR